MSKHLKFSLFFITILSFLTFSCGEDDCDNQEPPQNVCEFCYSICCSNIGSEDCCCFPN